MKNVEFFIEIIVITNHILVIIREGGEFVNELEFTSERYRRREYKRLEPIRL